MSFDSFYWNEDLNQVITTDGEPKYKEEIEKLNKEIEYLKNINRMNLDACGFEVKTLNDAYNIKTKQLNKATQEIESLQEINRIVTREIIALRDKLKKER